MSQSEAVESSGPPRPRPTPYDAAERVLVELRDTGLVDVFDDLESRLDRVLDERPRTLVVDMSAVGQISSTTIAALLWIRRRCSALGIEMLLRGPPRPVLDGLRRTGLLGVLKVEPVDDPVRARGTSARSGQRAEHRQGDPIRRSTAAPGVSASGGATRLDAVCGSDLAETVLPLADRWGREHALTDGARARLGALLGASLNHGLRFDPRGVSVLIRRLDPDRVRLDLRWHGSSGIASEPMAGSDVEATISTLDAVADQWGFGSTEGDSVHWMVFAVG